MSGFMRDAENMAQDFGGNNNQQQGGGLMNDAEQAMDNQGGNQSGGMMKDAEQAMGNQGGNQSGGSSGGFMSNLENQGKDSMMNNELNSFMSKEGVPQGADSTIDKFADNEANKFM